MGLVCVLGISRLPSTPRPATGFPFGMEDIRTSSFEPSEQRLQPGDLLVLCSDGVEEARSREGVDFGVDRVKDLVSRHGDPSLPLLSLEWSKYVLRYCYCFYGDIAGRCG